MMTFNKVCCSGLISWITTKFRIHSRDTIPLHSKRVREVRPKIGNDLQASEVPTLFVEVKELTFDRNGRPNVIIVKPSESTSEIGSNKSHSHKTRRGFLSNSKIKVEDLQQDNNVFVMTDHVRSSTSCFRRKSKNAEEKLELKPSSHLHKYFRMMHICTTAPLPTQQFSSLKDQKNRKWNLLSKH